MGLRKALWKSGLRYRLRPGLPGTPDLAFFGRKVAIFVDGCFWHGCPEHYTVPYEMPRSGAGRLSTICAETEKPIKISQISVGV